MLGLNIENKKTVSEKNKRVYDAFKVDGNNKMLKCPMKEAMLALESTKRVRVDINAHRVAFIPKLNATGKGLVFYPGGLVDPIGYAPLAKSLCQLGHHVVIVKMPLEIGFLGIHKGRNAIKEFSEVPTWAIAGHSLGGVVASIFAKKNTQYIKGIAFLASYPIVNLAETQLKSVTLLGTDDKLTKMDVAKKNISQLPHNKHYLIKGANHANFGYYGHQHGDGEASITREKQHGIATTILDNFLKNL